MNYQDYYKILGVKRGASQNEIRKAYRSLARKYHPDVSKAANAESRFKEVAEAYEVLKDPEKRAAYDQLGSNWQAGQSFQPPHGWNTQFRFDSSHNPSSQFSSFFESLFSAGNPSMQGSPFHSGGNGFNSSFSTNPSDRADMELTLEQIYAGEPIEFHIQKRNLHLSNSPEDKPKRIKVRLPKGMEVLLAAHILN